jgi:hypothetical protein
LASISSESPQAVCALNSTANYLNCGSSNPIVDGSGNLGIGTTIAHHLLDVFGNAGIKASGYLNFGTADGTPATASAITEARSSARIPAEAGAMFRYNSSTGKLQICHQ